MGDSLPPGRLALPDELLLLALDDERDSRARATELEPGLGGAVVLDLALRGRIDVVDGKVVVSDAGPTGDLVLDDLLPVSPQTRSVGRRSTGSRRRRRVRGPLSRTGWWRPVRCAARAGECSACSR